MIDLVIVDRESTGPLDSPIGAELRELEAAIRKGESTSIESRWRFGHVLLRSRQGKQLPNGMLAAIVAEHGISRSEIQYRIQFAETYPSYDEVSTAVDTYPSWREIRSSLSKKPKAAPAGPLEFTIRFRGRVEGWKPEDLTPEAVGEIDGLIEDLTDLLRKALRNTRKAAK